MPLWKCPKCQHEWEGPKQGSKCGWCSKHGEILVAETSFDKYIKVAKKKWAKLEKRRRK